MEQVLDATGVTTTYGDTVALDDVSVGAAAGEVLALVGPNGAGKTTLVRTLTGTVVPDEGTVRVLGEPPADADRTALGVLPQAFSPPERLTARELLRYYAGLYDDPRDSADVLAEVGLASAADTRYEALSGGQQRRVCLGAALVNDPTVLLLDEPTTGIDPAGRRTVRRLIERLAEGGATVLLTTHDMDEAERVADNVALLADGALRATDTPAALVEAHGGSPRLVVEPGDDRGGDGRNRDRSGDSDDGPTEADRTVDALATAGYESERRGASVVVPEVQPEDISAVVGVLSDADLTYESLEWRRPTLEDAYIALAGEGAPGITRGDAATGERRTVGERAPDESADVEPDRVESGGDAR